MFHNLIPAECLPVVTKARRELAEMLDHVNELFMVYKCNLTGQKFSQGRKAKGKVGFLKILLTPVRLM